MRPPYALILAFLMLASFGLAADAISVDGSGSMDLSSESTIVERGSPRSDQSLTDERAKVRDFIAALTEDEDRKPSQVQNKTEASVESPVKVGAPVNANAAVKAEASAK